MVIKELSILIYVSRETALFQRANEVNGTDTTPSNSTTLSTPDGTEPTPEPEPVETTTKAGTSKIRLFSSVLPFVLATLINFDFACRGIYYPKKALHFG